MKRRIFGMMAGSTAAALAAGLPKAAREVLNQRIDRHEEGKVSRRG